MRWFILLSTLALWLACMSLIYAKFCPQEIQTNALPGAKDALNALFDEETEGEREWALFINPQHLFSGDPKTVTHEVWDGISEQNLAKIGTLHTSLSHPHFGRAKQTTNLALELPLEQNSEIMKTFGHVCYTSEATFTREEGLETCNSELICGAINVKSWGIRDGGVINLTTQFGTSGKSASSQHSKIQVGALAAPNLEMLPFQKNREIRKGYSWPLVMLDTAAALAGSTEPKILQVQAVCTGIREIIYNEKLVRAFEAATEDGKARAWYSADGVVLKQEYTLFNLLDVMVVRRESGQQKKAAPHSPNFSTRRHGDTENGF